MKFRSNPHLATASLSRREFGRRSLYTAGGVAAASTLGGLLTACGSDEGTDGGGKQSDEIISPRFASSTSVIPIFVQQAAGPLLYGKEFGLDVPESNYQVFQSHSVAIQTVLSGDADIVAGSVFGSIAAAAQGVPVRLFSTARNRDDNVIAASSAVSSLDALVGGDYRVTADSKGGTGYAELQAIFNDNGFDEKVGDLEGFTILESSGQRQAALAAGQVDAAIIHVDQFWAVQREKSDIHVLARSVDVPAFPLTGYAAMVPWLAVNRVTATAIIQSIAACAKAFTESFDEYKSAVEHLIEEPPSDDDLKSLWDFAVENDIWVLDGTVHEDAFDIAAELCVSADVILKKPDLNDAVDTAPGDAA
jgi:ABC-type nitrate/sulfonate/bicarbonate transport system substrate-binding protein